jgi:anti-sigma B factor antagonist
MRLNEVVEDGGDVFYLQGEIDLHYSPVLRSLFQSKIKARCPVLILDLSGVDYIDSTGLAAVMEYLRDTAEYEGILCLTALNERLKAIFEIVGLDKTIPIFATTPAAKIALKEGRVPSARDALINRSAV